MFVLKPRSSGHNVHCERVVSKNVESHSTEHCQAEEACQVFENVRDNGSHIHILEIGRRVDNIYRLGLCRLQRNSKIIKRRRGNAWRS